MLRKAASTAWKLLKWAIAAAVILELFSMCAVALINYFIYGHVWEGNPVNYDPYAVFLNRKGPRPTAHNSQSPDPALNRVVWCFGGSTMYNGDRDEETLPSCLARELNQRGRPRHYTVRNFGERSFNSLLEIKYLQKALITSDQRPDLILFYDGANDAVALAHYRSPQGHFGYRRLDALMGGYQNNVLGIFKAFHTMALASYTRLLWEKANVGLLPLEPDSPVLRQYRVALARRYEHARRMAEAYGAKILVIWQPLRWVQDCSRSADQGRVSGESLAVAFGANTRLVYQEARRGCGRLAYFRDFSQVFCQDGTAGDRFYKPDGVHLIAPGRQAVARSMAGEVLDELAGRRSPVRSGGPIPGALLPLQKSVKAGLPGKL